MEVMAPHPNQGQLEPELEKPQVLVHQLLDQELEQVTVAQLLTGDDQFVSRTMLKLSSWKSNMETINNLYQNFQTQMDM